MGADMKTITLYVVDDYLLTRIAHKKYFANDDNFKVIGDFQNAEDCLEQMKKSLRVVQIGREGNIRAITDIV